MPATPTPGPPPLRSPLRSSPHDPPPPHPAPTSSPPRAPDRLRTALTVAPLLAAAAGLALLGDLARHLEAVLVLLAAGCAAQAAACVRLERSERARARSSSGRNAPDRDRRTARRTALAVLGVALLLRLPLLGLPPTLSDDLWRYLWDGRVAASGADPWRLAPDAPELAPLRDELWRRLPHREVPTVYPPLAMATFTIAAALPGAAGPAALKAILTAADLGTCALLLALARRRGLPAARAAWYAWSPVVALEIAGMGHVDALGAAAAVGTVLLLLPRSPGGDVHAPGPPPEESPAAQRGSGRFDTVEGPAAAAGAPRGVALAAGAAAAAGVLAKLAPAAALPMWARQSGRPGPFLAAALGLAALGLAPMAASVGGVPPGLVTYGVSWEHAGALFEPLWRLLDRAGAAPALAGWLERVEAATGWYEAWDGVYPLLYPQLLAKAVLAAGAVAVVARSLRQADPVAGSRRLFGGLLVVSATFYPWYLLWVLPFAALGRSAPWLLLAVLSPLLYLPQLRAVPLFPAVWLAVWGPPAALAAALAVARRRR